MPSSLDRLFQSAAGTAPPKTPSGSDAASTNHDPHQPGAIALPGGYTKLPNGIVLDPAGKPCKQCTSGSAWRDMMRASTKPSSSRQTTSTSTSTTPIPAATALPSTNDSTTPTTDDDCPPDIEALGTSTWTLLHTLAATYPPTAPASMQATTLSFLSTFSHLYPCGTCASDFRDWMKTPGNEPRVKGQDELGQWMCEAHNAVNVKLGKKEFDCSLWKQRWRDGWVDGRCD